MQKVIKETTKKKLVIPYDVLGPCGFERGEPLEIRTMTNAAVILKPRMHALEVIHAVNNLQWLMHELTACLMDSCDRCDGGDKCAESTDGTCPYLPAATNTLRPEVLREAGIPKGVKLCAQVNEGTNTVTVAQADLPLRSHRCAGPAADLAGNRARMRGEPGEAAHGGGHCL